MRPHLSFLIVVIALGASSAAIAASTSTSSAGGGASSSGGGGAHGGGGGGSGGHGGGVGGHAVSGGGFSNSGRFGSANLGRGSFSQAVGGHVADRAMAARTALHTASISELDKKHPGNPEHHHHRWSNPTAFTGTFGSCAILGFDRDEDFIVGPNLLCGGARKAAPINPKTVRPAG
jgi:hypothetical protein